MTAFAKVNRRRAWALFTVVWVATTAAYYWNDIALRYGASFSTKAEIDLRAQEARFTDCLNRTNTTWFSLRAQYGEECRTYAREECKGSLLCAEDWLADLCLKGKSPECRSIYFVSTEQLKDFDPSATRRKEMLEHLKFYLGSSFSEPLKIAVLLMLSVPIALAVLPSIERTVWKWVTSS
jgi:hypothetical protein